ncbi:MAG: hypothetical protein FJY56_20515 [Betaproteobacteria bacterium]|nr:hypothetical protein [Betaproteobacteria bacterium]
MTTTPAGKTTVTVYEPTASVATQQDALAPRMETLDGKLIGLLDNTKDKVEVLLNEVKALLAKDFPNARFQYFRKESVSGAPPGLMEQVAQCNAVITAVGD